MIVRSSAQTQKRVRWSGGEGKLWLLVQRVSDEAGGSYSFSENAATSIRHLCLYMPLHRLNEVHCRFDTSFSFSLRRSARASRRLTSARSHSFLT